MYKININVVKYIHCEKKKTMQSYTGLIQMQYFSNYTLIMLHLKLDIDENLS